MKCINLGNCRWFNPDSATIFTEGYRWDGRNYISLATESQWEHQGLYRTAKGTWVLRKWSDWQGSTENYSIVSDYEAYAWLFCNNHSKAIEKYFADRLEISEV